MFSVPLFHFLIGHSIYSFYILYFHAAQCGTKQQTIIMPGFVRFLNQSDKNNRSPCHFIKRQRAVFASAITAIFLCRFLPTIWTVYKTRRAIPQAGYESRVQYHIAHGKQGNPFCSLWPFAGYLYVCGPAAPNCNSRQPFTNPLYRRKSFHNIASPLHGAHVICNILPRLVLSVK